MWLCSPAPEGGGEGGETAVQLGGTTQRVYETRPGDSQVIQPPMFHPMPQFSLGLLFSSAAILTILMNAMGFTKGQSTVKNLFVLPVLQYFQHMETHNFPSASLKTL